MSNVEDLTTVSGQPMFDERTRDYLRRARLADPTVLAPYQTRTCPECEEYVSGEGFIPCSDSMYAHVVIGGAVILGCEGYFVVNPGALGMEAGQWEA